MFILTLVTKSKSQVQIQEVRTGQNQRGGNKTCSLTASTYSAANMMAAKVVDALWEICTESHPFAAANSVVWAKHPRSTLLA